MFELIQHLEGHPSSALKSLSPLKGDYLSLSSFLELTLIIEQQYIKNSCYASNSEISGQKKGSEPEPF